MNKKTTFAVVTLVSISLLVCGCISSPTPTPTPAPTPTSTSAPTPTSTSAPTPTSTSAPTPTSNETSYQDTQWLTTVIADGSAVDNDLRNVGNAAQKSDLTALSIYANSLSTDSQKAIDNSDLYEVSPDLQSAKDEYKSTMVDAKQEADYINTGLEANNKGDTQSATSNINEAATFMNSSVDHSNKYKILIATYKSKHNG